MRNFNLRITDRDGQDQVIDCDAFAIEDRFIVYEIDKIATFKPHTLIAEIVAEYTGPDIEDIPGSKEVYDVSKH